MLLDIKLYGGLSCRNESLDIYGLNRFRLEMQDATSLKDIKKLLQLEHARNYVCIVDGHAQQQDYVLNKNCSISIFPPMADRKYNFFEKI